MPLRFDDWRDAAAFPDTLARLRRLGLRSVLILPFRFAEPEGPRLRGALAVARRHGWAFVGASLHALAPLCGLAGLAFDQALRLSALTDRRRPSWRPGARWTPPGLPEARPNRAARSWRRRSPKPSRLEPTRPPHARRPTPRARAGRWLRAGGCASRCRPRRGSPTRSPRGGPRPAGAWRPRNRPGSRPSAPGTTGPAGGLAAHAQRKSGRGDPRAQARHGGRAGDRGAAADMAEAVRSASASSRPSCGAPLA